MVGLQNLSVTYVEINSQTHTSSGDVARDHLFQFGITNLVVDGHLNNICYDTKVGYRDRLN